MPTPDNTPETLHFDPHFLLPSYANPDLFYNVV